MSDATLTDLLALAQRIAYDLADVPSGRAARRALAFQQLAAWPALATAAERVLTSPGQPLSTPPRTPLLQALSLARRLGIRAEPDPQVERLTQALGAVADLLTATAWSPAIPRERVAVDDAVATILLTTARVTRGLADNISVEYAGRRDTIANVAMAAAQQRHSPTPDSGPGQLGDLMAPTTPTTVAVARWAAVTTTALAGAGIPGAAATIQRAITDLRMCCLALGHLGPEASRDAWLATADLWEQAARSWTAVATPIPAANDHRLMSAALRQALPEVVTSPTTARRLAAAVMTVTETAALTVPSLVDGGQLVTAARRLAATQRPVPLDLAAAARRGKWIPIPAGSPLTDQLRDSITAPLAATRSARRTLDTATRTTIQIPSRAPTRSAAPPSPEQGGPSIGV